MSNETKVPNGNHMIAYNCEICGGKTYCPAGEPLACANGCVDGGNAPTAEPTAEPTASPKRGGGKNNKKKDEEIVAGAE